MPIVFELMSLDVWFVLRMLLELLELFELLYGVVDCVFGTLVSSIGVPLDVGSGSAGGEAAKAPAAASASASPPARNVGERVCNVFMACSCSGEESRRITPRLPKRR